MSNRSVFVLIVLLLVAAAITWVVIRNNKKNDEAAAPLLSVFAFNQTKNLPATQAAASPNDVIVYTLTAENQSDKVIPGYVVEANISEVTDKSTLIDASGASYNSASNSLVWPPLDIPSKVAIQKQFNVRVNPAQAGSTSTVMKLKFNNQLDIAIQPASQQVAGVNTNNGSFNAPTTGPDTGSLSLWLASLTTALIAGVKKFRLIKA